jgi:hypothetical protein
MFLAGWFAFAEPVGIAQWIAVRHRHFGHCAHAGKARSGASRRNVDAESDAES